MSHDDDEQNMLWDLIRQTRFAMVTTQCGDGRLRSFPPDDTERPRRRQFWLLTPLSVAYDGSAHMRPHHAQCRAHAE
jgi:hypothetical protein